MEEWVGSSNERQVYAPLEIPTRTTQSLPGMVVGKGPAVSMGGL